jgi:protease secretion system membrane fusion protein
MKNISAEKNAVATVVTSREVEVLDINTDATSYARLGWLIVIFGVVGFIIWASLAPLDQGVPLSGTVSVAGSRKAIQHQVGGTIDEILVKEGESVKAGQVLVRMNSVVAKSGAEIARVQWHTALATEARLLAEREASSSIKFPKTLIALKNDPTVASILLVQQQLFDVRRNAMSNDLSAVDENIAGLKIQVKGLEESLISKKQQQVFAKEQVESLRELAKEGYVARNRLLDAERNFAQINGSISEDIGNIGRTSRQVAELTLRKSQRLQEYQKEVRTQLSDVQRDAESLESRLKGLDFELNNVMVKAPVSGVVVGLNVFTNGGVVPPGFKLMEIVPQDEALIVDAILAVNLVDKVHAGLKVDLIFSAFNTNKTPHIPGVITQVSADRTVDERTGQPYYKVKAAVTPEGTKMLGALQVRPGMPVEMFVNTGERTMMNYLFKPILDRSHSAMKEE